MLPVATERRSAQAVPALHTSLGFMAFDLDNIEGHDRADLLWLRIGLGSFARAVYLFQKSIALADTARLDTKPSPLRLTTGTRPISGSVSWLGFFFVLIAGPTSGPRQLTRGVSGMKKNPNRP